MTFKDRSRDYRNDLSFSKRVPDGDAISRNVCDHCGLINYENPKIVAGVVAVWQDRILLCRRAIEPRLGFWTLPAGFMENNETIAEGAAREAFFRWSSTLSNAVAKFVKVLPCVQPHFFAPTQGFEKELRKDDACLEKERATGNAKRTRELGSQNQNQRKTNNQLRNRARAEPWGVGTEIS